jgi:threonine/homoserine/homoserine lactone efflux protein
MIDYESYSLFIATACVLVMSPGPDTVLILSRTVASGAGPGLLTVIGTQTGNVIHALLAGLGVSTIISFFPIAFDVLRYGGAAYLLYLAWITWRAPAAPARDHGAVLARESPWRYFRQGLLNNLANPKMIPFFIALFPQFIRPEAGPVALQSLVLGLTLAGIAVLWLALLVIAAGKFRAALGERALFLKLANRLAAATFFGLACRLALQRER